jgi:hypothetical protein
VFLGDPVDSRNRLTRERSQVRTPKQPVRPLDRHQLHLQPQQRAAQRPQPLLIVRERSCQQLLARLVGHAHVVLIRRPINAGVREDIQLYLVKVLILTGNPKRTLSGGKFLLVEPSGPTDAQGSWWSDYIPVSAGDMRDASSLTGRVQSTWCYKRNLAQVRSILGAEGIAGAGVRAAATVPVSAQWTTFQSPVDARAAAAQLLRAKDPLDAQFAATTTGSSAYVGKVSDMGSQALLEMARTESTWAHERPRARVDAEEAISLHRTSEAERLLASLR